MYHTHTKRCSEEHTHITCQGLCCTWLFIASTYWHIDVLISLYIELTGWTPAKRGAHSMVDQHALLPFRDPCVVPPPGIATWTSVPVLPHKAPALGWVVAARCHVLLWVFHLPYWVQHILAPWGLGLCGSPCEDDAWQAQPRQVHTSVDSSPGPALLLPTAACSPLHQHRFISMLDL